MGKKTTCSNMEFRMSKQLLSQLLPQRVDTQLLAKPVRHRSLDLPEAQQVVPTAAGH